MDFRLESIRPVGTMLRARFIFRYPANNLKFKNEDGQYKGAHHYHWALYDEDYRDAVIIDPTDRLIKLVLDKRDLPDEPFGLAQAVLFGEDNYSANYIKAFREGKLD